METICVTWILQDGSRKTAAVETGGNLMEAALDNAIDGIVGQCGGSLACATCHVVIEEAPAALPDISPDEDDMLDMAEPERLPGSRLSCQLLAVPELDGIVLRVP
ncbi:MAG: 2Fe-2S iron-sulfur cluster binding domain-containing protein [Nisaea sp.]|uniref:2Fe-2S iron-sulfur cluster-binding protein n=1 Tax=Nisaea sp. TaxID=2024842 RepID=UPI001B21CB37|nr:2Fe-2S iron-sulfur cluster-binding protein [Nisaea sp.]MBO6561316.1 2Fe-2S iron-sulfur cluster binding domain-containing protein [Nisaea sp.]